MLILLAALVTQFTITISTAFAAAGALDVTFNGTGIANYPGILKSEGLAIDGSGRIIAVGMYAVSDMRSQMSILRYNADGTLDTTFNGTGFISFPGTKGRFDRGIDVVIDSNGKIVVVGTLTGYGTTPSMDMAIWRYNADGTLDTSFNNTGFVVNNGAAGSSSGVDVGRGIVIDNNGKIIVTGISNLPGTGFKPAMAIWRYNADGSLDTSFNATGFVTETVPYTYGNGVALDNSGKIVVTGSRMDIPKIAEDMGVWRFNLDGSPDTTFNGTGSMFHNSAAGGDQKDVGYAITVDSNGKLLVTGYSAFVTTNKVATNLMTIWRINIDGTLDSSFNSTGFTVFKDITKDVRGTGHDIAIDSGGNILISGTSTATTGGPYEMTVWRYKPDGSLDNTFNNLGVMTAGQSRNDIGFSMALDSNQKIVIAGERLPSGGGHYTAIWRVLSQ